MLTAHPDIDKISPSLAQPQTGKRVMESASKGPEAHHA
jgi:hypothetical protein